MKKSILLLFAALLPLVASAYHDFEVDGIYYNITSEADKTLAVTYMEDDSGDYNEYSITIPATVTHNGVEYSVTSIGERAFYKCSSLAAITLPEGVTSIGYGAFSGCSSLTSMVVAEGNTIYDSRNNCNAIIETSSNTLTHGCSATIIPEGVTSIGEDAFSGCSRLTAITIPEGVTSIGRAAFWGCSSLTAITLPEGVTSVGDEAFYDCTSLTAITLPEGVTSIGDEAFNGCSSLTAINIPESVTSIGEHAFYECSSLTAITIPEGVTSIGYEAFRGCSSLIDITIPEGVTSIGERAFYNCSSLTAIDIPEGVTSIGTNAFSNCISLTTIVLPRSVGYIDSSAFADCSELSDVYCYAETVPSTKADAFNGSYSEYATLHVPESAVESYKSITPWSNFGKIVPLTEEEAAISNAQSSRIKVQGHHGTLRVTGAAEGDDISVYTTDGTLVTQESAERSETEITLPTDQVYLVHIGDKVVKIGM